MNVASLPCRPAPFTRHQKSPMSLLNSTPRSQPATCAGVNPRPANAPRMSAYAELFDSVIMQFHVAGSDDVEIFRAFARLVCKSESAMNGMAYHSCVCGSPGFGESACG